MLSKMDKNKMSNSYLKTKARYQNDFAFMPTPEDCFYDSECE